MSGGGSAVRTVDVVVRVVALGLVVQIVCGLPAVTPRNILRMARGLSIRKDSYCIDGMPKMKGDCSDV
jgi:hypothetical protein